MNIPDAPPLSILERSQLIDWDFQTQTLTTGPYPLTLHRAELTALGVLSIADLKTRKAGRIDRVGGSVISRQRPPTAKGMCFIILQDETGYVPAAMTPQVYERFERALRAPQLVIEGTVEDSGMLAGNCYRSILIDRLWPLDTICNCAAKINRTGAAGHPGENPRSATLRSHEENVKASTPEVFVH